MEKDYMIDGTNYPGLDRRADDIGRLAWQLVGDENTPPDFTAAIPLLDAVTAEDVDAACRLRGAIIKLAMRVPRGDYVPLRDIRNCLAQLRRDLGVALPALLYDFGSAVRFLGGAANRAARPDAPVEESKAEVTLVWADVGWQRVGNAVVLDDGRTGRVMMPRRPDGRSGVMLDQDADDVRSFEGADYA